MAAPRDIEELYARAQADMASNRPGAVVEWAFLHAAAEGRRVIAEKALTRLESKARDRDVSVMAVRHIETMANAIAASDPHPTEIANAEVILGDLVAWVTAAATVLRLLTARQTARAETPAAGTKFGVQQGGKR